MNQNSREKFKNSIEKGFYKLLNNSNFGYDCRNNLDNCQFVPIFDEYKEVNMLEDTLTFLIQGFHNLLRVTWFDKKLKKNITIN